MSFDPETFLNTDITGSNSTEYVPIPEGEYNGIIKAIDGRSTQSGKEIIDVNWVIDDQTARDVTGMEEATCRQSLFLDFEDNGSLSMGKGKNVELGRLRKAVGQNDPSKPWRFSQLIGQAARVKIAHSLSNGRLYANVTAVTALPR